MEEFWSALEALSTLATAILVVATLVYAKSQLSEAGIARQAAILEAFRTKYRSIEMVEFRLRLLSCEFGTPDEFTVEGVPREERAKLWWLLDELEYVAVMVERGLLDFRLVVSIFRHSPAQVWHMVEQEIGRRRDLYPPGVQYHYLERLYQRYVQFYADEYGVTEGFVPTYAIGARPMKGTGLLEGDAAAP